MKNWLNKDNSTLELTICTLPLLFAVIKSTPLNYDEKYEQKYDSRSRGTEFKVVQPKVKKVINLKDGKWFLLCMQSTFQEMLLAGMVGYGTAFVVVLLPNTLKYVYTVNKIVNTTMSAIIVDDKKKAVNLILESVIYILKKFNIQIKIIFKKFIYAYSI